MVVKSNEILVGHFLELKGGEDQHRHGIETTEITGNLPKTS